MTTDTVLTTMPIDIETFDDGSEEELNEPTNAEKVLRYLFANSDLAFTPSEIADGASVNRNSVSTVLRRLKARDLVRHKGEYWALGDEEKVRDAYQFHRAMADLDEQFGEEDVDEWRDHAPQ